jgi:hypothetical protein
MSKSRRYFEVTDATSLIGEVLTLDYFHPAKNGAIPIPAHFVRGPAETPLVLVVGENASGKSFIRRLVTAVCREVSIECIHTSMEGRGGSYGGLRGFIYGDESWKSTGVNSVGTVSMGIRTCLAREKSHVVFWDEPDLGLSENGAAGVGQAIASYAMSPNPKTVAAVVVTHSKPLVQEILHQLTPHYLHLGVGPLKAPATLADWIKMPVVPRSIEDIEKEGLRRFKLIQAILNKKERLVTRHRAASSYGHLILHLGAGSFRISWTVDRYYAGSRLRYPRGFERVTDLAGARRFARKHGLPAPDSKEHAL